MRIKESTHVLWDKVSDQVAEDCANALVSPTICLTAIAVIWWLAISAKR